MITFTQQELLDLFKMVKPEKLNTHLDNTIKTTRKTGIQALIKLVEQETLPLDLFTKIKTIAENPNQQYQII
jgi:hypothetical protein